jgi:hypothetical protein
MDGVVTPLLVYLSSHYHPLLRTARQEGWRVESAESSIGVDFAKCAAFIAENEPEAARLRSLCPDAVAVGASAEVK